MSDPTQTMQDTFKRLFDFVQNTHERLTGLVQQQIDYTSAIDKKLDSRIDLLQTQVSAQYFVLFLMAVYLFIFT